MTRRVVMKTLLALPGLLLPWRRERHEGTISDVRVYDKCLCGERGLPGFHSDNCCIAGNTIVDTPNGRWQRDWQLKQPAAGVTEFP